MRFVSGEGWLGDRVEESAGLFDAPAALAGFFEVLPALPADAGRCFDEDGDVRGMGGGECTGNERVEGVDSLDNDERRGMILARRQDRAGADPAVGLETPDGGFNGVAAAETVEVVEESRQIDVGRVVSIGVGDRVVVGEVVVGGENTGGELPREGGFSGSDWAGDGQDCGGVGARIGWLRVEVSDGLGEAVKELGRVLESDLSGGSCGGVTRPIRRIGVDLGVAGLVREVLHGQR